jgi:hypothetical protein
MYLRPCWVVDLSQVKTNATTHRIDIIRLQKDAKKAALVENLELMSIQASRDVRCNGTPSLLEARNVLNAIVYQQTKCTPILQLALFQHIGLQR